MRRVVLSLIMLLCCGVMVNAQNIQLHYDFGNNIYDELGGRAKLTTTVEMFKPDKWGSTFFFVDMDYAKNEVASAYWEIARELKFWKAPVSIHVEYDGGINYIKDSYLGGVTYTYNNSISLRDSLCRQCTSIYTATNLQAISSLQEHGISISVKECSRSRDLPTSGVRSTPT